MPEPDILILQEGRPIGVVEVKGRTIPRAYRPTVLRLLERMALDHDARWSILVDPSSTQLFAGADVGRPVASLETDSVIRSLRSTWRPEGERGLALAIEHWLVGLRSGDVQPQGELTSVPRFVADIASSDEFRWDPRLA